MQESISTKSNYINISEGFINVFHLGCGAFDFFDSGYDKTVFDLVLWLKEKEIWIYSNHINKDIPKWIQKELDKLPKIFDKLKNWNMNEQVSI